MSGSVIDNQKINLLAPEFQADPFPTYRKLRETYPVCQVEPHGLWAISRYDDACFALTRSDLFSSAGFKALVEPDWLSRDCHLASFITQDPPDHTKYRTLVNKAFGSRIINALIPFIQKTAQDLVGQIAQRDEIELIRDFADPYVGRIALRITGTEEQGNLKMMRQWADLMQTLPLGRPDPDYIERLETVIREQRGYFRRVIENRRKQPKDDLVSALVNAEIDGETLDDNDLSIILELLVGAGFQTTTQTLCFCMIQLARCPDLSERLIDSPALIPDFIEEVWRYNTPVRSLLRKTTQPVTVSGITIPKDATVLIMLASANRDATQFSHAEEFDMTRTEVKKHIAFGRGPHTCIGSGLARLEAKIILEIILSKFSHFACPEDNQLNLFSSLTSHGFCELPVQMS